MRKGRLALITGKGRVLLFDNIVVFGGKLEVKLAATETGDGANDKLYAISKAKIADGDPNDTETIEATGEGEGRED